MITMSIPTLNDIVDVTHYVRQDEVEQYEILSGREWNSEEVVVECFSKPGVKFVLLDGNKPFAVGGWEPLVNDVWQSWMIGNMVYWETHWRSITKLCRSAMRIMFTDTNAKRLQTCVLASRTKTCEWYVRGLKMQAEGIFRCYGANGEDMAMYARIKE